ncbi:hypothetical protein M5689_022465 [Euphorbia peplus]|nr:hypothetical protein M5689_022465 [Euphorbia peplus]
MEETLLNHSAASGDNQIELLIVPNKEPEPERERLWSLKERIKKAPELLNSRAAQESCSIIRVPHNMMELYPRSFQPGIVSIGPYYHGDERFRMMEEQKCRILGAFLNKVGKFCVDLDQLYQPIKDLEEEIRDCYSQNIDGYKSCQLIDMMILDGCFIIHLLSVLGQITVHEADDPIFNFLWMLSSLTRDLLLLENQIPFFVLKTLYSLCLPDHLEVASLQELILTLINYSLPRSNSSVLYDKYRDIDCKHILDFYRSTCIPSPGIDNQGETLRSSCWGPWWVKYLCGLDGIQRRAKISVQFASSVQFIQPVETLLHAGIEFKKREDVDSFLDIGFSKGKLKIPHVVTGDIMSSLMLNCIVFEQCYQHRSKHFISYFNFMAHLLNTSFDAGYLREKKIIENFAGTDLELVNFFSEVGNSIPYCFDDEDYLMNVTKEVEIYYRNPRHVGLAEFKKTYCASVWIVLSASAAVLVIFLTLLQTFYAVFAYYKPNSN